jgi:arylsulfatase A-like enzyme
MRLRILIAWLVLAIFCWPGSLVAKAPTRRPNVILIMTDDQGFGDLGAHGNPLIRTPMIDRLARDSVELSRFYVCPVCSPTRASLLTGRYNYRTGVVDTYQGRSVMHPDEVTLAERLSAAGYRTGIFGKWHLGDNAPSRPVDQGFQQSLVLKGGGIGQPSDLPGGSHYHDPVLLENGTPRQFQGYCSDVFTTAAISFLKGRGDQPFFLYLAFNCPHDPLEAPERERASYQGLSLADGRVPDQGYPLPHKLDVDRIARVYAMVTNIDANIGRLLAAVDTEGIRDETIVIFLTDNGAAFARYNAGLRGLKGQVYEGGIRVPCYVRWPGHLSAGRRVEQIAAHIDIVPTLLEACQVSSPAGELFDGRSLMPLLRDGSGVAWPERTLCLQWHRGNVPQEGRAFMIRTGRYKLLRADAPQLPALAPLELYDLERDPYERSNLAPDQPERVDRMYRSYQRWFRDVSASRGYGPAPIHIGGPLENPTLLTPQDWRPVDDGPKAAGRGCWHLQIVRGGRFEILIEAPPGRAEPVAHVVIQDVHREQSLDHPTKRRAFRDLLLREGTATLECWFGKGHERSRPASVTVRRIGDS